MNGESVGSDIAPEKADDVKWCKFCGGSLRCGIATPFFQAGPDVCLECARAWEAFAAAHIARYVQGPDVAGDDKINAWAALAANDMMAHRRHMLEEP